MYKISYTPSCTEDINFENSDFDKRLQLNYITPYKAHLSHGKCYIYMPERYLHYMQYLTASFSMSLRSLAKKRKISSVSF